LLTRGIVSAISVTPGTARFAAVLLLAGVLTLGLFGRRFWCRCLCPTGALLSLASMLRLRGRTVDASCVNCGRCREVCNFDAVADDFSTCTWACTHCGACTEVCPVDAIHTTWRFADAEPAEPPDSTDDEPQPDALPLSRRGFIGGVAVGACAVASRMLTNDEAGPDLVRPPGSLPEPRFRAQCVRCGECMRVCPTGLLQPAPVAGALWAPRADRQDSACRPDCNNCGHSCPTGAIRALPLEEKRAAHIGRAELDRDACIRCHYCLEACTYGALTTDSDDFPLVHPGLCVGCGACRRACFEQNVRPAQGALSRSAILVLAGQGRDDRIATGSYLDIPRPEPPAPANPDPDFDFDL